MPDPSEPPPLTKDAGWRRRPHVVLCLVGGLLVVLSSLAASAGNLLVIPFILWMLLPWAVLLLAGRLFRDEWIPGGAAVLGLTFEAGVRSAVFLYPQGSTAAVALVFSPAIALVAAMPVGGAAGWLGSLVWRRGRGGRVAVVLCVPSVLFLVWLALARPEKFPLAVARREAALTRIGPPRVAVGRDTFQWTTVSTKSLWPGVGDVDGKPGEELVLATQAKARYLDPATLAELGEADYSRLPPATWSWYSRLARVDGRIVIVQSGGGYSNTKVLALDGSPLWEYRPNPELAPDSLRPADLDGDGATEFYSASTDGVVRLDGAGRVRWRQQAANASLTDLAPRNRDTPGWVLAVQYGVKALVWDETGRLLAERPVGEKDAPLAIVDHARGRALVCGGSSARGVDLSGQSVFEIPLPDMNLSTAQSLRFAPGQAPHLALTATADRHTRRWRALIVAPDGQVIYDEISEGWMNWLVARKADRPAELFLSRPSLIERLRPAGR